MVDHSRIQLPALALLGFALLAATAAAQPTPPRLELVAGESPRATLALAGGGGITGGQIRGAEDGAGGCTAPRGFVRRAAGDCSALWERFERGAGGCAEHPAGCLLDDLGAFPPAHVVSSEVLDLALDPTTGQLAAAGEMVLAWQTPGGGLAASRGGFLLLLDADGFVLADAYFGRFPEGPPPDPGSGCNAVCELLVQDGGEQTGVRGVAFDDDGNVVVAGWRRPPASVPGQAGAARLLVASLSGDLATMRWLVTTGNAGDVAVDLERDASGAVILSGTTAAHQSFFARVAGDGTLEPVASPPPAPPPSPCVPPPAAGPGTLAPAQVSILKGQLSETGGLVDVAISDDAYLQIAPPARPQQGPPTIELLFDFLPGQAGVKDLHGLRFEVKSFFCFEATIALRALGATEFEVLGERQLCATDEPVLHVPIDTAHARALGFDGVTPPPAAQKLSVLVTITFLAAPEPCAIPDGACQTVAQDASVDQMQLDVDY